MKNKLLHFDQNIKVLCVDRINKSYWLSLDASIFLQFQHYDRKIFPPNVVHDLNNDAATGQETHVAVNSQL